MIQRLKESTWIGPALSGILAFFAEGQINFYVSWIFYVPLFIAISHATPRQVFVRGFLYGAMQCATLYYWMIPGAEKYTGQSMFYGVLAVLLSMLFLSLYHGLLLLVYGWLKRQAALKFSGILNGLLLAAVLTTGEWVMMYASEGFPWFDVHSGAGLAANNFSIQPAALFGIHILSFVTIIINYFLAVFFIGKLTWQRFYIPAATWAAYMFFGFALASIFNNNTIKGKPFNVALLVQNLPPDLQWGDANGDLLAKQIFQLNATAAALHPAMILWTEAAIPWTYQADDDLLKEVLKITKSSGTSHVIGMNTAHTANEVYNSAYYINADGAVNGRYDKQIPLSIIEQPWHGVMLPFFANGGLAILGSSTPVAPIVTPHGKLGIFICNEGAIPAVAAGMVSQGAQYLFNLSNDTWFSNTFIVRLHFFYARLRAVESRKDVAISSNNGYSGLVKASGEIAEMRREEEPFVQLVTMESNDKQTLASRYPSLFVYVCLVFIIAVIINDRFKATRKIPGL